MGGDIRKLVKTVRQDLHFVVDNDIKDGYGTTGFSATAMLNPIDSFGFNNSDVRYRMNIDTFNNLMLRRIQFV